MLPLAQAEARAAFGDDAIYLERFLDRPLHIEVQLIGDGQGRYHHLGERELLIAARAPENSSRKPLARP